MPHISEVKNIGIKFLIFGPAGTGKSHFSSTMDQPIYYFDTDHGMKTIFNRLSAINLLESAQIDYDTYWDGPHMERRITKAITIIESILSKINPEPNAYVDWENKLGELVEQAEAGECKYKTVVFDSLTTLSIIFINYIMYVNKNQGRMFALPNLNDMGNYIRKLPELIGMMHLLNEHGIHTVVTAHMQMKDNVRGLIKDPKKPELNEQEFLGTFRLPNVIGKELPFTIGAYFDEVYSSFTERSGQAVDYYFETKSDKDIFLKSRSQTMPLKIEQDWSLIKGHLGL